MNEQPIDGTVVDETTEAPSRELVPARPALTLAPQVQASELVDRLAVIREAQESAMVRDVDYGVIPGTDKPALYKPGAEKLSVLFQLDVQLVNEKTWGPGDHLTVISHATVYHAPSGARLGYGEGVCTTRERKYAYRKQERTCPSCGAAAVIKGKAEFGGGWVCWKKRDGCGANFKDGDGAIENQPAGEVDNPDLPDLWNTVVKMAEKRARVDAVLAVTGASALFSQDTEDMHQPVEPSAATPAGETCSQSQRNLIYERASGRLLGSQLLNVLLAAKSQEPAEVDEEAAIKRIEGEIDTLPAAAVPVVLKAIEAAIGEDV